MRWHRVIIIIIDVFIATIIDAIQVIGHEMKIIHTKDKGKGAYT